MLEHKSNILTAYDLKTYLYSLEKEKEREKMAEIHAYRQRCNSTMTKPKKRQIAKIEKQIDKEYVTRLKTRDELLELLEEIKTIPKDIEELEIAEYMLYRVDLRKAEKVINKVSKSLSKRYDEIQDEVEKKVNEFPILSQIVGVDFSEYDAKGNGLEHAKEQYKLEYTEEEREALIQKEVDIIEKVKYFNSVPIPHEILKNSDKDIQSKMQKFNNIRQRRIKILDTMKTDYEKLLDPREIMCTIDDAIITIDGIEEILTKAEYTSVKSALNKRKKKVYRSTNEIRNIIEAKEKKTGIQNFNIQQARYVRMENLRTIIIEATNLIKANPLEELEKQLEKLKISYEREKQFASVIEKLDNGTSEGAHAEVKVYEEQIMSTQKKLNNSRRIVEESEEKIRNAKKELLVLWKMEITSAVNKKANTLALAAPTPKAQTTRGIDPKLALNKLKKASGGKHAMN